MKHAKKHKRRLSKAKRWSREKPFALEGFELYDDLDDPWDRRGAWEEVVPERSRFPKPFDVEGWRNDQLLRSHERERLRARDLRKGVYRNLPPEPERDAFDDF